MGELLCYMDLGTNIGPCIETSNLHKLKSYDIDMYPKVGYGYVDVMYNILKLDKIL